MASFNPTPAESALLAQIAQRESGGNYRARISQATCNQLGYTVCTASGAYQFIDSTWQSVAQQTGVGTQWASAADAPASVQDINALWLLRNSGTTPWATSGPYDTTTNGSATPLLDVSGAAASTPTADLLNQIDTSLASLIPGDSTGMGAGIAIAVGAAVVALLATR